MRFVFVDYAPDALDDLAKRRIDPAQVWDTLAAPDALYLSTRPPGRLIAERMGQALALRVVYLERIDSRGSGAYVISVYRFDPRRMKGGRQ